MADQIPLILNTSANQIQEMPAGDTLDLTGSNINGVGILTVTTIDCNGDLDVDGHINFDNLSIAGVSTFTGAITANGSIDLNSDLDVDGHTNLDNVNVAGVTTFAGVIEGVAGQNKIPSLYNAMGDLPNPGTYHGMFAHVHSTGRGYFSHAGGWYELVNAETNGVVGTGTQRYNLGALVSTSTTATSLNIAGVSTFAGTIDANGIIEGVAGQNKIPSLYNAMTDLPSAGTYHGMFAHVHATQRGYFAHGGGWYELVNKESTGVVGTGTESYNVGNIIVGSGVTIESNGQATFTGIVTFGSSSTTIEGDNNVIKVGTALTLGHTQGVQFHTQNLHSAGFEVNQINASGIITASSLSVSGNISVGGTLTYEDVTNVDSIGIITARSGVDVDDFISVGSNIHLGNAGIITASSYRGDGSQLTGITGTTINNNADNRIITGSGTANTLNGESTLTYDGTNLDLGDSKKIRLGTGNDLEIFHDGSDTFIENHGGGGALKFVQHDSDTMMFRINTTGNSNISTQAGWDITGSGHLLPSNNNSYYVGGSARYPSRVYSATFYGNNLQNNGSNDLFIRNYGATDHIKFRQGASQSDGWNIGTGGHFVPSNDSAYDIGANATRVRNLYADTLYGDGSNLTGIDAGIPGISTTGISTFRDVQVGGAITCTGTIVNKIDATTENAVVIGYEANLLNTNTDGSVIIGHRAGYQNATGKGNNVFLGRYAAYAGGGTQGSSNTIVGDAAGMFMYDNASRNVALGVQAGYYYNNNDCVGVGGYSNWGRGEHNTAIGGYAYGPGNSMNTNYMTYPNNTSSNQWGNNNIVIGYQANLPNSNVSNYMVIGNSKNTNFVVGTLGVEVTAGVTTHAGSVVVGAGVSVVGIVTAANFLKADGSAVGGVTSDANQNTVGGSNAGDAFNSDAERNTLFGYNAGTDITAADNTTAIGNICLENLTTGNSNTAIGHAAMRSATTGHTNVAIGRISLYTLQDGNHNVAIGNQALYSGTSYTHNIAIGYRSQYNQTNGENNISIGSESLLDCAGGGENVVIGHQAGHALTTADYNVLIGYRAGYNMTDDNGLTLIGYKAGYNENHGTKSTAVGYLALHDNTSGEDNTAIGYGAMYRNYNGDNNTALGRRALNENVNGHDNTALGEAAGYSNTASNNIYIGKLAAWQNTSGSNNIVIGREATSSSTTVSNEITLGNSSSNRFRIPGLGLDFNGNNFDLGDNKYIRLGSSQDLEIFHDGSHSYVKDVGTGDLVLQTQGGHVHIKYGGHTMALFQPSGYSQLYFNNSLKFATTGTGVKVSGNARTDIVSVSDGSNITIPMNTGTHFTVTLGGNRTFINSNMQTSDAHGASGSIFIVQDGTGGRTAAFQSNYKFAGGTAPTLSTAANAVDRLDYVVRDTNVVHCVLTLDVK